MYVSLILESNSLGDIQSFVILVMLVLFITRTIPIGWNGQSFSLSVLGLRLLFIGITNVSNSLPFSIASVYCLCLQDIPIPDNKQ